jgi:hypothetical protein
MQPRPLYEALEELRAALDDIQRASHRSFEGVLGRYVSLVMPGTPLGDLLQKILPKVDFASFWKEGTESVSGSVGSGALTFPNDKAERVAMQLELLIRMNIGAVASHAVIYNFYYRNSHISDNQQEFVRQVIIPFQRDLASLISPHLQEEKTAATSSRSNVMTVPSRAPFIAPERIERFRELDGKVEFDLRKLIRLAEEANLAYGNQAWHSVAFVTRTILNHVPPAFGQQNFDQVAGQGQKHFKAAAKYLQDFARKVADFHMHEMLEKHLVLPTEPQVNVSPQLDVLLGELERVLSKAAST